MACAFSEDTDLGELECGRVFGSRSKKAKDFLFAIFEETPEVILLDFPAKNVCDGKR